MYDYGNEMSPNTLLVYPHDPKTGPTKEKIDRLKDLIISNI